MGKVEKSWQEAISVVLKESRQAMHYVEITEEIIRQNLRKSLGATPAKTVNAYISLSIKEDKSNSPYARVDRGTYILKEYLSKDSDLQIQTESKDEEDRFGLINSFGMYWDRNQVDWDKKPPKLLGVQQRGAQSVDFSPQLGVYILYDGHRPIYIGRTAKGSLGIRLYEHTDDRLKGRWNRFSWFGVLSVTDKGELKAVEIPKDLEIVISTFESLLIEAVEPSQNRRRGDDFNSVEYLQIEDPVLTKKRMQKFIADL